MSVDTVAFYIVFGSGSVRTVWILRKCNCGGSSTLNRIVKCNRKLLTCRLRLCTCVEKLSVKRAKVLLSALRRCWIGNLNNGYISHAYTCRFRRVSAQETMQNASRMIVWLLGRIACITWECGMLDAALDATICSMACVCVCVCVYWTHCGSPAKTEKKPIDVPFMMWIRVGPRNHAWGVHRRHLTNTMDRYFRWLRCSHMIPVL